ncbi:MAG: tRNA(Ile2) 2-agmatinylcytidine synthetase TiaS [Methanomassiliicoccales archaeon PtaU1.Bin030]|nr:MAG: tRNA(Ile2) 2-agmatinylcytidine synthetase TiaS [Methanomassiliicoccales archaeon PtaU1.Bin030]
MIDISTPYSPRDALIIAADDTDSSTWMCTTFLATELVRALPDLDVIGLPRLVRLNPAVPWKTRGNGAIGIRVGKGKGLPRLIGRIGERDILSYARSAEEPDADEVLERCRPVLERWSQIEDSDPGLAVCPRPPRPDLYLRAVSEIIPKEDAVAALREVDARTCEINSGRGLIGAAAAASWVPRDRTYEVLTYRRQDLWGSPREVSSKDVSLLDERFPSTFNNFDAITGRPAIVPHTTCPILYGIRGDSPMDLYEAYRSIHSEPVDRWLLFISNQGTDDHVLREWTDLVPNRSYEVEGEVLAPPRTVPGGHVIFALSSRAGPLECAAYEPSKGFRDLARALAPGDRVKVVGELREQPRTLNLEKFQVISLAPARVVSNPPCPRCGKNMKSAGRGQGYRCRRCGTAADRQKVSEGQRALTPGWYEPPVCSRRHLSKPLKRMGLTSTIVV